MPAKFTDSRRRRARFALIAALALALVFVATGCREDDPDDESTSEDRRTVLCDKIADCGFEEELEIDDCESWAEDLSKWLLGCAVDADGCGDLAECFNIAEGVTP